MNGDKKDKLGIDINNLDLTPVIEDKDNESNAKKEVKLFPDIDDNVPMKDNSNLSNNIVNKLEDDDVASFSNMETLINKKYKAFMNFTYVVVILLICAIAFVNVLLSCRNEILNIIRLFLSLYFVYAYQTFKLKIGKAKRNIFLSVYVVTYLCMILSYVFTNAITEHNSGFVLDWLGNAFYSLGLFFYIILFFVLLSLILICFLIFDKINNDK